MKALDGTFMAMIFNTSRRRRLLKFEADLLQIALATLVVLTMTPGCEVPAVMSSLLPTATFHEKLNLHAVDFFEDEQVVELCEAIEDNDLDEMKRLIAAGVDVNTIGKDGITPLFWAFPDNQLERFVLLLKKEADPNVRLTSDLGLPNVFRSGDTVMHLAARSQFPTQFLEVIKHGGNPTVPGRHGDTVLHEIIRAGVRNADERIAAAVAKGADINAIDHLEATPIETAVGRFGQYDLAIELLEMGADPTIASDERLGNTIHSVLANKRSVDNGKGVMFPREYAAIERFLAALQVKGYDVDQAQEDIERWAELSKQNPSRPGWFRKNEILRLKKRNARVQKAEQHANEQSSKKHVGKADASQ
ncbi:Ankyrin repeats (3 copies) [Allorhodopirellula heiligendammensis]|uniref:Ankyrin repeats (3 copies) n=2 Tax=Allorhodopirellula heiligendammensis TaxID=2714739 RepID=A0A5C6C6W3_9BACT|nr:Ankyrin repeats (3 copies) [Allorhodopirellula heiligendammensis]